MGWVGCTERFLGVLDTMAGKSAFVSHTKTDRLACVVISAMLFFSTFWAAFEGGEKRSRKELFVTTLSCK
jgi:hypothetical protein